MCYKSYPSDLLYRIGTQQFREDSEERHSMCIKSANGAPALYGTDLIS